MCSGAARATRPTRQRTLRATIDWSHRLLDAAGGEAFARFAVFAGGATTEAAEAVTGADVDALQGLVDKQLLLRRHGSGPEPRLSMLETVREYAGERLDARRTRPRFTGAMPRTTSLSPSAPSPSCSPAARRPGCPGWTPRSRTSGRRSSGASARNPSLALRLAGLLSKFWVIRSRCAEGLDWIEAALEAAGDDAPVGDRARARRAHAELLDDQGAAYDCRARRRSKAKRRACAVPRSGRPGRHRGSPALLGGLETAESPRSRDGARWRKKRWNSRARPATRGWWPSRSRSGRGALLRKRERRELDEANARCARWEARGTSCSAVLRRGVQRDQGGRPELARPMLDSAAPLAREVGHAPTLAFLCGNVGMEALFANDLDRARGAFDEQLGCVSSTCSGWRAEGLSGLAAIAARQGDPERAAHLLGAATATGPWDGDADVASAARGALLRGRTRTHGTAHWNEAHGRRGDELR